MSLCCGQMLVTFLKKRQMVTVEGLPVRGSPVAFPGQGVSVALDDGLTDIPAGDDMIDGTGVGEAQGARHREKGTKLYYQRKDLTPMPTK